MGQKGSLGKARSIRFPVWMSNAIEDIAQKGGYTFTDVVLDLLRQELNVMGYNMGIGRDGIGRDAKEPISQEEDDEIEQIFTGRKVEPFDLGDEEAV